jgi:hypothetical protein
MLAMLAGATAVMFGTNIHDLYVWEVVAPQLQQELGFRIGKVRVVDEGREHEVPGIIAVDPNGIFGRAGLRSGDIPIGYVHGFVGFYHHLHSARGDKATLEVVRPEANTWRSARQVTVAVPGGGGPADHATKRRDEIDAYRQIKAIRVGMQEAEVLSVAGAPSHTETPPFPPDSLPMTPGCKACEAISDCRLLPAVRRAHYEWRVRETTSTTRIEELDIYYDVNHVVTCTQSASGLEMRWSH